MKITTIDKLCCPFDKADLNLQVITQDTSRNVLEGLLSCKVCKRYYPIIKGIPIMNPDEYREFQLEQPLIGQWSKHLQGKTFDQFKLIEGKPEN